MTTYERYRKAKLDLAAISLGHGPRHSDYIVTPIGTTVFAWAGVDGIHFGFIRGQGETVFAFSPDNIPGACIHPIARNLDDFLCLVLAAGGAAALEQAWMWDEAGFSAYLADNPPTSAQQSALDAIRETFALASMERPFTYLKSLQEGFDEQTLPLRPAYRQCIALHAQPAAPELLTPWKVTFRPGRGRAGKCIPLDRTLTWAGLDWQLPAAYVCTEGLVLDCITNGREACPDYRVDARINGAEARMGGSSGWGWSPDCDDREAGAWIERYALDPDRVWQLHRFTFPWPGGARPQNITALSLAFSAYPADHVAGRYILHEGDHLPLIHPLTGEPHALCVETITPSVEAIPGRDDLPSHCLTLTYTLTPDRPISGFTLRDVAPHDCTRNDGKSAVCLIVRPDEPAHGHAAVSSLHFAPIAPEAVTWLAVFREKPAADEEFPLL